MSASYPTKLVLAFRGGDRCAFPECGKSLTVDQPATQGAVLVGEAAHIAGENPKAERYDANMTDEQRDHYNNLVYLCLNHHEEIDKPGGAIQYPVAVLHNYKSLHETRVSNALMEAFRDVGFKELDFATKWVVEHQPSTPSQDLTLITPDAKIAKNSLSSDSRLVIRSGISLAKEVDAFVEAVTMTDADFPERLKAGFLEAYYGLVKDGVNGDERFVRMCRFATQGMIEYGVRAAALAILVYMFERCEIFEK